MTYDVHAHVANLDNPKVAQMHADAEVFDARTEVSKLPATAAVSFTHAALQLSSVLALFSSF